MAQFPAETLRRLHKMQTVPSNLSDRSVPLHPLVCRRPANWTLEESNKYACTSRTHAWGEICFSYSRGTCIKDDVFFPQRLSSPANLLTFDTRAPFIARHFSYLESVFTRTPYAHYEMLEHCFPRPCFRLNFGFAKKRGKIIALIDRSMRLQKEL